MKVFVDSDVVISSLISSSGAAHFLLNESNLKLFISNHSFKELKKVVNRLDLNQDRLKLLVKRRFKIEKLKSDPVKLNEEYKEYVLDPNDAHIVAGGKKAKARFLISYNIKHYKVDKIKRNFNILVTTPAKLLQYLRSIS